MYLDEKMVAIEHAFESAEIAHAFGGANALAYYATPRATVDIDVNVFVGSSRAKEVLALLAQLGANVEAPELMEAIERDGQARVFWETTPIDLFFSYDPLHQSSMERRRRVDFGVDRIHILSAEDLLVYKAVFNREKDWRDIAETIFAANDPLDFDYVRSWLDRILEGDAPQHARLERLIESGGADL